MRQKVRTSWNLVGFGRLGDSGDSGDWEKSLYVAKIENLLEPRGIREIGGLGASGDWEKRYMWQKWERLSGRTHGKPTNWKIGDLEKNQEIGNFETLEGSGDWKIRESGISGRLGKIIKCGKK